MTSVFALVALGGGKWLGWRWLDPAMGVVGAAIVASWSYGLLRDTSRVLLDREMDHPLVRQIRAAIESDGGTRVADLHLLRVGRRRFACVISVVSRDGKGSEEYKRALEAHPELVHVTVEVLRQPERSVTQANA
jgi:Co/Zn/Cd efflux system component